MIFRILIQRLLFLAALASWSAGTPVFGAEETPIASEKSAPSLDDVDRFCQNISEKIREERYRYKEEKLQKLQAEVEAKLAELESKRREIEEWVGRREGFANLATDALVEIYQKMRPDAAASRLAEVSPQLASSILLALPPTKAGVILNEMDPKRAALITAMLAASARKDDGT
jgi:flagellar motility protein MotE (MotC chaperone)